MIYKNEKTGQVTEELPVIFRKYGKREGEAVIALFPTVPANCDNPCDVDSFMEIGGHGAASYPGVIASTKSASEDEYAPTLAILKDIYETPGPPGTPTFRLKIYRRAHGFMHEARKAEWRKLMKKR